MKIPTDNDRCLFTKRNGARCRMPRLPEQSLCMFHSQRSAADATAAALKQQHIVRQYLQGETAALMFPNRRDRLDSAKGVNRFLAQVARMVAEGRIEPKVGSALAYVGQTLLASLPHLSRERTAGKQAAQHPIFSEEQLAMLKNFMRTLEESSQAEKSADKQQMPEIQDDPNAPNE